MSFQGSSLSGVDVFNFPVSNCDSMYGIWFTREACQRLIGQGLCWRLLILTSSAQHVLNFQILIRIAGVHPWFSPKPYLLHKQFGHSEPLSSVRVVGTPKKSKFEDSSQGPILKAGLYKDKQSQACLCTHTQQMEGLREIEKLCHGRNLYLLRVLQLQGLQARQNYIQISGFEEVIAAVVCRVDSKTLRMEIGSSSGDR